MKKPEKVKLEAPSDDLSDGPETPRKISETSFREEKKPDQNQGQGISFGVRENHKIRPIETMISPRRPLSCNAEKQGHISGGMVELKESPEKELPEEEEVTQDEDKDPWKYESSKIDISIWEYFSSFIMKSERTKDKFKVLDFGIKNVRERVDILNIMKKFRELDKLKHYYWKKIN